MEVDGNAVTKVPQFEHVRAVILFFRIKIIVRMVVVTRRSLSLLISLVELTSE